MRHEQQEKATGGAAHNPKRFCISVEEEPVEGLSDLELLELVRRYEKLPMGRRAELSDSLGAAVVIGMLIGFVAWAIAALVIDIEAAIYTYAATWFGAGALVWGRGAWRYIRLLETTIITDTRQGLRARE